MVLIKPFGKYGFIKNQIPKNGKMLDVGCGNNSPQKTKALRPDIHYVGLDIEDYNQQIPVNHFADEYILTDPSKFADEIEKRIGEFDAVISCHNLEHCNDYRRVIDAMFGALRPGGYVYIAFPCENSVHFPSRKGTLNFYDDPTHKNVLSCSDVTNRISGIYGGGGGN
ncbi:MAG: class I SAM-dependent methyltransferase [Prevotellaceae bacterium]|nr:class I SAM-dependent methyltransferase [Prevotellaceae bacterium]